MPGQLLLHAVDLSIHALLCGTSDLGLRFSRSSNLVGVQIERQVRMECGREPHQPLVELRPQRAALRGSKLCSPVQLDEIEDDGRALVENQTIAFQHGHKSIGMKREVGWRLVRTLVQVDEGKLVLKPDFFNDDVARD